MALRTSKKLPVFQMQTVKGRSEIKVTSVFWFWRTANFVAKGYYRYTPEGAAKAPWSKRASTQIDALLLQEGKTWKFSHYE